MSIAFWEHTFSVLLLFPSLIHKRLSLHDDSPRLIGIVNKETLKITWTPPFKGWSVKVIKLTTHKHKPVLMNPVHSSSSWSINHAFKDFGGSPPPHHNNKSTDQRKRGPSLLSLNILFFLLVLDGTELGGCWFSLRTARQTIFPLCLFFNSIQLNFWIACPGPSAQSFDFLPPLVIKKKPPPVSPLSAT